MRPVFARTAVMPCCPFTAAWCHNITSCHRRHQVFCKWWLCKILHGASLFGHGPGHVLMYIVAGLFVAATGLLLACISCHRRHQVFCKFFICKFLHGASLFGHGPGHVLMYIVAGLFVAATGLLLACITRNVYQGPCVCSVARHNAWEWRFVVWLDCLRHRPRKFLLTSSTIVFVNIMTLTEIFNRQDPQAQSILCASIVLVIAYFLYPTNK